LHEIYASHISHQNSVHPQGEVLFVEGEAARGIYILRSGSTTSSISSHEGRVVILRIALAGDVLGLNSVLRNSSYDTTVKTIEPCHTDFISREDFLKLMDRSKPATCAILQILSHELMELADRTTSLLLPKTAVARLAQLLLEWCEGSELDNSHIVLLSKNFTQEEIGQMICSSRETVTRLLAMLTRRQIVQITADRIVIQDRPALQELALR
jgi:CRP/FNR family transcriptional regulator